MILRRLTIIITFLTAWVWSNGQQINAVPDYVFRNQMSVGRNAVTDTAAYFSIGPRYGANKGFMPPIVVDTAIFSSGKRNGLLIFSVQKNKFLYWDSVRVQWSDMAGSSGSYIVAGDTASMLTPYVRQAGYGLTKSGQSFLVDTLNIATRAWRQKGDDSVRSISVLLNGNQSVNGNKTFLADITFDATTYHRVMSVKNITNLAYNHVLYSKANGVNQFLYYPADTGTLLTDKTLQSFVSGTTNYIPKFTAGSTIGNSQIFDNGTNVGIGTTSPAHKLDVTGAVRASTDLYLGIASSSTGRAYFFNSANTNRGEIYFDNSNNNFRIESTYGGSGTSQPISFWTGFAERLRITSGGDVGIGTTAPNTKTEIFGGDARVALSAVTTSTFRGYQMATGTTEFASLKAEAALGELRLTSGFAGFGGFTTMYTNGSERLRIFANGRVGINTTTDAGYQLDVNGTGRFSGALRAQGTIQATNNNDNNSGDFTGMVIGSSTTGTARTASFIKNTSSPYDFTIRTQDNTATTTGSMIFQNGSTETMRITSGGNVGIGTTSPAQKLDVSGVIRANSGTIFAQASGTESSGYQLNAITLGYDATNTIGWITAGGSAARTNLVLQQSGGNVGIGTASPANKLSINGAANALTYFLVDNSQTYLGDNGVIGGGAADGNTALSWFSTKDLYFKEGSSTRMTIKTGGNVGIGTASPLAVTNYTGLTLAGTNGSFTSLYTGASQIARIEVNTTSDFTIKSIANVPLILGTNNTENVRITTSGNVGIGTASPSVKLDIGTTADQTLGIKSSTSNYLFAGTYQNYAIFAVNRNPSNGVFTDVNKATADIAIGGLANEGLIIFNTTATNNSTATERMRLTASGELLINTTTDAGDYKLQVSGNIYNTGSITTGAPSGGSIKPWKIGEAATVSPTSPNRTIRVEIDGVVYYLHAKTTND